MNYLQKLLQKPQFPGCKLQLINKLPSATAFDNSGQGNNGTITGATWVKLPSGLWVNSFDGTNDKIDCPKIDISAGFTCLVWWLRTGNSGGGVAPDYHFIIGQLNGGTNEQNRLLVLQNGTNMLGQVSVGGVTKTTNPATTIADPTKWHLIGIQWDTANVSTILDGALGGTVAASGTLDGGTATALIGYYSTTIYVSKGLMGVIRLFTPALSVSTLVEIVRRERSLFGV